MTWRRLACVLMGHRPVWLPGTFYVRCECCASVFRIDTLEETYAP